MQCGQLAWKRKSILFPTNFKEKTENPAVTLLTRCYAQKFFLFFAGDKQSFPAQIMSVPFSGALRRSGGIVSAIGKQVKSVNLKGVKRITVQFDPFAENVKSTR